MSNPVYTVKLGGQVLAHSQWAPLAQTAWTRATRNRDAAQRGAIAELWRDGKMIARGESETGRGQRWPDGPECDLRDVLKSLLQLLRDDGWGVKEIAAAMTESGLPTTRGRIDGLRGSTAGHKSEITCAELVVMLHAVLNQYKKDQSAQLVDPAQ